ncbi:MAG TPA: GAF domain-containing SpoIIE family protein phosphatase [Blastocatellia bacterium]|nr:GAF domain-containing SpoIIE family protein phosphatase [Blastocatellia bacterium]
MRIIPRFARPGVKRMGRRFRQWRRNLPMARAVFIVELIIYGLALLLLLTGSRAAWLDRLGHRADLAAAALAVALFGFLHFIVSRSLVPALERRFAPAAYDERRILFDLGQEARGATNVDHLYKSIVTRIGDALQAENVSIFVRDDATGDYVCRMSTLQAVAPEAGEQRAAPRLTLSRNAFVVKRLRHMAIPLVLEEADFEAWRRAFSSASPEMREARGRERLTLQEVKAHLLLQILIKEQLVGILTLGPRRGGHPYSAADKEMLMSVAGQLALVIENSKLIERMVAEERLRRELALAVEVQQRLFPTRPPESPLLDLSGFCLPARGVGGDYYDFLEFDNQQIGIALADVAGKGISAALLMSNVQAALRSQTMTLGVTPHPQGSVAELVSVLNRLLCRSTGAAQYVTFFYAQFDESTRQLTYINAGHNPPMLFRPQAGKNGNGTNGHKKMLADALPQANGSGCLKLTTGGPVIGMFSQSQYEQESIQLQSGDILVAYTDGVTEALNAQGEEFGETQLQEVLSTTAHLSAQEIRDEIVKQVQAWCAGAPQHDDLTFIVLKVK